MVNVTCSARVISFSMHFFFFLLFYLCNLPYFSCLASIHRMRLSLFLRFFKTGLVVWGVLVAHFGFSYILARWNMFWAHDGKLSITCMVCYNLRGCVGISCFAAQQCFASTVSVNLLSTTCHFSRKKIMIVA